MPGMPAIGIGCVLCALLGALGLASVEGDSVLRWVYLGTLGLTALAAIGAALIAAGRRKVGAIVVLVGSLPQVPIGLIAAWGARTVLDTLAREDFERRRKIHAF